MIENFEQKGGMIVKKDHEGHLTHYSRVPTSYDSKDRFKKHNNIL
jgi:hypothetical protein